MPETLQDRLESADREINTATIQVQVNKEQIEKFKPPRAAITQEIQDLTGVAAKNLEDDLDSYLLTEEEALAKEVAALVKDMEAVRNAA